MPPRPIATLILAGLLLLGCSGGPAPAPEEPPEPRPTAPDQGPQPPSREAMALFVEASDKADELDRDGALQLLERALAESPDFAAALGLRGTLLLAQGAAEPAERDLSRALELSGDDEPGRHEWQHQRGRAYERLQRFDDALADYGACLTASPDYVPALTDRGILLAAREEHDEALADFRQARQLEQDPDRQENLDDLIERTQDLRDEAALRRDRQNFGGGGGF